MCVSEDAQSGTTSDTNTTTGGTGDVISVYGGGYGHQMNAATADSTITVNNNVYHDGSNARGGWIYGGGYGAVKMGSEQATAQSI